MERKTNGSDRAATGRGLDGQSAFVRIEQREPLTRVREPDAFPRWSAMLNSDAVVSHREHERVTVAARNDVERTRARLGLDAVA